MKQVFGSEEDSSEHLRQSLATDMPGLLFDLTCLDLYTLGAGIRKAVTCVTRRSGKRVLYHMQRTGQPLKGMTILYLTGAMHVRPQCEMLV